MDDASFLNVNNTYRLPAVPPPPSGTRVPTARRLLRHLFTASCCDEPLEPWLDAEGSDDVRVEGSDDPSSDEPWSEPEVLEPEVLEPDGLGALGVGVDGADALGDDEAAPLGDGRFIGEELSLPGEVLSPLALQPTSRQERATAPNVANDRVERMDRRPRGLELFVIMLTTLAVPNLGHRTVNSRPGLTFS